MRVFAILALSAAALPLAALADPAPAEAPAPAATQTAPVAAPTMTAQTSAAAAAPAAATASTGANLDEIECRTTPPPTGSRLGGGRECHTVREWNDRMREDQRMIEQRQNVPLVGRGGGG